MDKLYYQPNHLWKGQKAVKKLKMLEKNEVKIWLVMTKYKQTHTAFVEALNKVLPERLFKVQDAQEFNDPEKVSSRWVKHLYGLVDEFNDMETEMIGMKPKDAIKLNEVPLVHVPNLGGLSGSEDRGGVDNSIQFINFGRVGDKRFKEWRQK